MAAKQPKIESKIKMMINRGQLVKCLTCVTFGSTLARVLLQTYNNVNANANTDAYTNSYLKNKIWARPREEVVNTALDCIDTDNAHRFVRSEQNPSK